MCLAPDGIIYILSHEAAPVLCIIAIFSMFLALEDIYEISLHGVVTVLKPFSFFFLAPKGITNILSHEVYLVLVSYWR